MHAEHLTFAPRDRQPLPTFSQSDDDGLSAPVRADTLRVMVVEDEWIVSLEIEAALEDGGHDCVGVAATAREALALAESTRPQLVLMDIRLKDRDDGVEVAKELRRRFGLSSLFISAHADAATKQRAADAEPLGWLQKPFSGAQLLQKIASVKAGLGQK
ncbi:response regulator [Devosia sp. CAU 1758]